MKGDSPRAHSRAVKKKNMKTNKKNKNTETPGLENRIAQPRNQSNTTAQQAQASSTWRAVFFRGPEQTKDKTGADVQRWSVYVGDDQGQPVKTVYGVYDFRRASSLARVMSAERKLELINEAHPPVEVEEAAAA
jgi:hypothetical protein